MDSNLTQAEQRGKVFDVLVIGGGIVGAGVARDASLRGLRTLLIDQADFAFGSSSRSSRLLHGGLRYLAQGHFGLVREASSEKLVLSRIAPHLCQPLPFFFPLWNSTVLSLWKMSAGVHTYDLMCGGHNFGRSATYAASDFIQRVPGIRTTGLVGGTCHFDALTNDARLVIDTLLSAEEAGATLTNYTAFEQGNRVGPIWEVMVRDRLHCAISSNTATSTVRARTIVNAAGAWASSLPNSQVRLRLTKGAHVVVDRTAIPTSGAVALQEGARILFVIPWGDRQILGTTDTDYSGDAADVRTEPEDVDYILRVVNDAFPAARIDRGQVISSWAGVRPLIAPRGDQIGKPSDISRSHQIGMAAPGWFDVAGGKLTTYRLMAEQTVDRIGRWLKINLPRSPTARLNLPSGPHSAVLPPPVDRETVMQCCRHEWARCLDDVMLRRTSWHYYHRDRLDIAVRCGQWMSDELGWDANMLDSEIKRYHESSATVCG